VAGLTTLKDILSMTTRSKDEVFEILSSARRRRIIYYLAEESQLTLNQLATKIAAVETDTPEADVTGDERQRVYISLYQTHLPKLEEAAIVAYDDEERTVSLTDDIREEGFFWMETEPTSSRPWRRYYAGLAVLGWLLVVVVSLSATLRATLGWAGVAVLLTLALTALVAAQQYTNRSASTDRTSGYELLVE
jgi:DNA-binding transcriptional ArsR family regulator